MGQGRPLGNPLSRILITGGFGFVGGRLARHLWEAGYGVVLGSREVSKPPDWLSSAEVVTMNWQDSCELERACLEVDVVIHAAGMNAQDCEADPVAALHFNGVATARLATSAARAGVRRFIHLSTAHVYGSPLIGTITEETCPRNLHPYATSHLSGEHVVMQVAKLSKMNSVILRLSNGYGEPAHKDVNCWSLLVNDVCRQAIQHNQIVLNTDGRQFRDFVPVKVICDTILHLIDVDEFQNIGSVINVGTGHSRSVLEMAELIRKRCQLVLGSSPAIVVPQPTSIASVPSLNFSVAKLNALGVRCNANTEFEIDQLLKFCQAHFSVIK